jgi:hypothetical protein
MVEDRRDMNAAASAVVVVELSSFFSFMASS